MIKTKQYTKNLSPVKTEITDSTIPGYVSIQVCNDTLNDITVYYNSDTTGKVMKDGDDLIDMTSEEQNLLHDVIYMTCAVAVTVTVELKYWEI